MSIDTRAKRQSAAWVGYPGAPSVLPVGSIEAAYRSQIGWSYWTFALEIQINALYGTRSFGQPTLLETDAPGSEAFPYVTVFINGVDRSGYVRVGQPSGPGIKITRQINSRGTASFTTIDTAGSYSPSRDDEVVIYHEDALTFRGTVERATKRPENGTTVLWAEVLCNDYGVITDRRVVGKVYSEINGGGLVNLILYDIVQTFLAGTGITYSGTGPSASVPNYTFYYVPAGAAISDMARLANADWYIDSDGVLRLFNLADGGYTTAPASFTDASENWRNLKVTESRSRFANRIYVKSSKTLEAIQVDTFEGNPGGIYINTYPFNNRVPTVTVNGSDQRVTLFGAPGDTRTFFSAAGDYDFYILYDGHGLFYNQFIPQLSSSDEVVVSYLGPLPYVGIAKDDASIAAVGLYEAIVEAGEIDSKAQLDDIAAQYLARGVEEPVEIDIETDTPGWEPGQRVTVNVARPAINDQFIISSVAMQEYSITDQGTEVPFRAAGGQKHFFRSVIRASNADFQQVANPNRFMSDLIERSRNKINNIIDKITMTLAETIEGFDNPGLTTGEKEASRPAQKDSVAGWITLHFKSVLNGTPITTAIEVDVFQNGVSIFPVGEPLVLEPGEQLAKKHTFVTDPLRIRAGDIFTFEVLAADSAAKDGVLELVGLG